MTKSGMKTVILLLVAAMLIVSGCATKRDVMRVEEKINNVRANQTEMMESLARVDSLVTSDTEESALLRAEIRTSLSELLDQFRMIQASMNDLTDKVSYLAETGQRPTVIIPSTAQADSTDTAQAEPVIPGIDCQQLYDDSFINVRRGQYEEAIKGFTDYLNYCGMQDQADNARFWIGESYYSMEKYNEAIEEFKLLEKDFSNSEKRPGALYKMARSHEELGQKTEAKETFNKLIDEFPGTLEAEQAKEKLKELN
jgi:tol-pal system protein YbgF